jgi:hypothetical protein
LTSVVLIGHDLIHPSGRRPNTTRGSGSGTKSIELPLIEQFRCVTSRGIRRRGGFFRLALPREASMIGKKVKLDQSEIDYFVRQYGLTREEARELIRVHGDDRKELDAAAGRLKAARLI